MKEINSKVYMIGHGFVCCANFETKSFNVINITDANPKAITEINGVIYINNGPLIITIQQNTVTHSGLGHKSDIIHLFSSNFNELVSLTNNSARI